MSPKRVIYLDMGGSYARVLLQLNCIIRIRKAINQFKLCPKGSMSQTATVKLGGSFSLEFLGADTNPINETHLVSETRNNHTSFTSEWASLSINLLIFIGGISCGSCGELVGNALIQASALWLHHGRFIAFFPFFFFYSTHLLVVLPTPTIIGNTKLAVRPHQRGFHRNNR